MQMNSFSGIKSVEGEDNLQTSTCIVTTLKHPHPLNCLNILHHKFCAAEN